MAQDYERQTEELCRLFSNTLQSLASDAEAVRQLSSLAKVTGVENAQPNISPVVDDSNETLKGLRNLDKAVTVMEQKVVALRSIVSEEKKAIAKFEGTLKEEAEAQTIALESMMQACDEVECQLQSESPAHQVPLREVPSKPLPMKPRRDSVDPRRRSNDDHQQQEEEEEATSEGDDYPQKITFNPIKRTELQGFSRNTLGRIQLIDLNEALEEIEVVAQRKFDSLPSKPGISSSTLQRRYDYLKQQRANVDSEVEAHAGHFWVSEQEIRESCIFFRNGESSARTILSVLCSLKRLKQVPGRNRQVTYLCLVEDNSSTFVEEE